MMPVASGAFTRHALVALLAALGFASLAAPAAGQISGLGPTVGLAAVYTRGVDAAYDPVNNIYLVVGGFNAVTGIFVNANGAPLGAAFTIKPPSGGTPHAQYPSVAWAQHANNGNGGFLVIWPSENSPTDVGLHGRTVAYPRGPYGVEQRLSDGFTAFLNAPPAVGYSPTSQKFLVVWPTQTDGTVKARLIGVDGAPSGGIVQISAGYGRNPAIAWNSASNDFGVSFSGEVNSACTGPACQAFSAFVRVPAGNIAAFRRNTFNIVAGVLTTITDIDYNANTNQYVMTWFETNTNVKTVVIDAAGNPGLPTLVSNQLGSYDALGLAYNPISKTNLLIGLNRADDNILAAEVRSSGFKNSAEVRVNTAGALVRYPRVAPSAATKTWNIPFTGWTFAVMGNQIVQTTSTGDGTPGPTPPPPPPPPPPTATPIPRMNADRPTVGSTVTTSGFTVAGWAVDLGAATGTGVNAIHVWAYPATGAAPLFLGAATYGYQRPDVGAIFGSRFTPSGFGMTARINSTGTFDVIVYARSTVTGTFNQWQVRRVTVTGPISVPRMAVDGPQRTQTVPMNFSVAGWAIDAGSSTGTGVDAIHVWAFPVVGGSPIFLGAATYGIARPDVGTAFANPRYTSSGFALSVTEGQLPRGAYNLVVYARSSVANTFNKWMLIPITVV